MKYYISILLVLLSIQPSNALTLEQSVSTALLNNQTLKYTRQSREQERIKLKQIESDNYPRLNLNAKLGKADTKSNTTLNKTQRSDIKEYTIGLKQNLFSGYETTNNIKQQENIIMTSYNNFNAIQNDIILKVTNAYYNIIKHQKILKAKQENVKVIKKLYTSISKSYKSGFAILSDVKKVEATLQNARYEVLVEINAIDEWVNTLEFYTSSKITDRNLSDITIKRKLPDTLEETLEIAYKNNPELLASMYTSQATKYRYKSSASNQYPTVDLYLEKTKSGDSDSYYGTTDQTKLYLNVNYTIAFAGEEKYIREIQAKEHQKAIHDVELQKDKVRFNVTKIWQKLDILNKQKKHLEYYYTYSQSTIDLYKQEYDIGNRKLLDLLIAQAEFVQSKTNLITANYDYKIQVYELLFAMGKNINPIADSIKTVNTYHHIEEIVYSKKYKKALMDPKNRNKYVINLAIYEYRENLRKLIFRHNFQNNAYAYRIKDTNLMKAVYGIFNTKKEALREIKRYRAKAITNNVPYVTKIKIIQDNIAKQ